VPKSANPRTLVSAVRLVLSGEIYVPPLMVPRHVWFQDILLEGAGSLVI
jgi:hypothetical protein